MSNSKKTWLLIGIGLIVAGLYMRSQRVELAIQFEQARVLFGMPLTNEDATKVAVFAIFGSLMFLGGLVIGIIGFFKK